MDAGPAILTLKLGEKSIERASATCRENSNSNNNQIPPSFCKSQTTFDSFSRLIGRRRRSRINEGNAFTTYVSRRIWSSFRSRGTCYISGAKEENAIDSGAPLFWKWNGSCISSLFLNDTKVSGWKKTATCEFSFSERERRRGAITRTNCVPLRSFFSIAFPFYLQFVVSTAKRKLLYFMLTCKIFIIFFFKNLKNKKIKILLLLFLSGRAFRQREKGGCIVVMRFLITIVQFTPPPLSTANFVTKKKLKNLFFYVLYIGSTTIDEAVAGGF